MENRRLADFASKAAETFVSAYYAASDSPQRTQLVPSLYLPTSSILWNGNPLSGSSELAALLGSMPGSKHEVQAFDCHALGGALEGAEYQPPSVILTVTGTVSHHTPESQSAKPESNAPKSTTVGGGGRKRDFDPDAPISSHPRSFSQSFVLVNVPGQAEGGIACSSTIQQGPANGNKVNKDPSNQIVLNARYFAQADSFRFVG
ncbi:NTF2-like protein [Violaceomyces palustris]|uniref:NTF2-like protein n=1 Tax=Violaceomyces palustris TaxID=1673888 RepID=A0ACD0NM83_9BASI|nr:NTF2-like protein [Violaceomyces palustris]